MEISRNPSVHETASRTAAELEERVQSNLFNRILILIAIMLVLMTIVPLLTGREDNTDNLEVPALLMFFVALGVSSVIRRVYGLRPAVWMLLLVASVLTYGAAVPDRIDSLDTFILGALVAWVIMATIFLTLREALFAAVLHGIGILIFAYVSPMVTPIDVINGPWLLYIMLSSLVLLLAYQRSQLEVMRSQRVTASELRLRTITETIRDAIFMTDAESRIVFTTPSAEDLFGRLDTPLLGTRLTDWLERIHPEDRLDLDDQLITLKDSRSSTPFQYRYLKPDKPLLWVETVSSLVRDSERRPTGMVFVSRNITERKRNEAQRFELGIQRERFHLFQRFISDVSHDLRTPLAVISTSMYLLRKKLKEDPTPIEPHLNSIQAQIAHLEKQLDNLTTLSRLQNDQARYQFEPRPLNAPVEQLAVEFQPRFDERRVRLVLALTEVPTRIMISEVEFIQALRQVLTNALQFTPEQGVVTMRTSVQDNQAAIEISDTGSGIDTGDLAHIFEPLYRADRARSIDGGGLGLGLSVARTIIEAHVGTIEVRSQKGQGTVFTIHIPALIEPAEFYTPPQPMPSAQEA